MDPLLFFLLRCFYLVFPGAWANMAPVFVKNYFKKLAVPVDMGKKLGKKRIFGNSKTVRGVLFGVLFSVAVTYVQFVLYRFTFFRALSFFDYGSKWLYAGLLIGLGVMVGDLLNSFVKRRFGLKPGKPFIPFDQINGLVGALIFIIPVYVPSLQVVLVLFIMSFILHIAINLFGYVIGLKKTKL